MTSDSRERKRKSERTRRKRESELIFALARTEL